MNYITVRLTEDQARHLEDMVRKHAQSLEYTVEEYSKPREEIRNYNSWIADGLGKTKERLSFDMRILEKLARAKS